MGGMLESVEDEVRGIYVLDVTADFSEDSQEDEILAELLQPSSVQLDTLTEESLKVVLPQEGLEKKESLVFLDHIYFEEVAVDPLERGYHVMVSEGSHIGFIETDVSYELSSEVNFLVEEEPESNLAEVIFKKPLEEEGRVSLVTYEKGGLGDKFSIHILSIFPC